MEEYVEAERQRIMESDDIPNGMIQLQKQIEEHHMNYLAKSTKNLMYLRSKILSASDSEYPNLSNQILRLRSEIQDTINTLMVAIDIGNVHIRNTYLISGENLDERWKEYEDRLESIELLKTRVI